MSAIVTQHRTAREKAYGLAMIFVGVIGWPILILGLLGAIASGDPKVSSIAFMYLLYGVGIALFYWISSAFYRATAFGNMVLLGPDQFPELHAMVLAGARELSLNPPPRAFLYNSNGVLNAFARRLLGGRYVFLTSALVEASSDDQVRFVIGHELGHHAAGHLNPWMNALKLPGHIVPFLGPAYSRAREFTCDAIGAHLSNNLTVSRSALLMLGCGCRRLNGALNCEAFMAQEAMVPPITGFVAERFRSHPRLTRRLKALKARGAVFGA